MNTIDIDPGYAAKGKGCACCYGVNGQLTRWWFARPIVLAAALRAARHGAVMPVASSVDLVSYECPQQDARSYGVPPEVLIRLAAEGAALAGIYAGYYQAQLIAETPTAWKGSVAKPVQHGRLWALLRPCERRLLGGDATALAITNAKRAGALDRWKRKGAAYYPRGFEAHNVLDAVAMMKHREGLL